MSLGSQDSILGIDYAKIVSLPAGSGQVWAKFTLLLGQNEGLWGMVTAAKSCGLNRMLHLKPPTLHDAHTYEQL
jgi:hypothetical protein